MVTAKRQKTALPAASRPCCLAALFLVLLTACQQPTQQPDWVSKFDYAPEDVHPVEAGDFGYPYVQVNIGDKQTVLPFDTGNMVGLTVSSGLFDELGLEAVSAYERLDSAGNVVGKHRVAEPVDITLFGRRLDAETVYEFEHPALPGLIGPAVAEFAHFTIDYASGMIAAGSGELPATVAGFQALPLVRSTRHPYLVLVAGKVNGRDALFELDTGKSRTVINPGFARSLALPGTERGVRIDSIELGGLTFAVQSAKIVDQAGIDPGLPQPILAGIGSDILSKFAWTVDYEGGNLWIPEPEAFTRP